MWNLTVQDVQGCMWLTCMSTVTGLLRNVLLLSSAINILWCSPCTLENLLKINYPRWNNSHMRKFILGIDGMVRILPLAWPTCNNYSQMWEILEPTVVEQQTMPWCAGLPTLEHSAVPHQMDDWVPCSMTTMSYHPGMQESRHHLEQMVAISLLNIVMPVLDIYLKKVVAWISPLFISI